MNISNLVILSILIAFVLFFLQRTERKRVWLTALILVAPLAFLLYRWAIYKNQVTETIIAALIGLGLNAAYWLLYGRTHPPASSDEITVVGSDQ